MAGKAQILEVIYADAPDRTVNVMVTIGDTVRAQDWARAEYPEDKELQEQRGGLYAVFLGAKRQSLPGTDGDWLDWLDLVTIPEDEDAEPAEAPEPGE